LFEIYEFVDVCGDYNKLYDKPVDKETDLTKVCKMRYKQI